MNLYFDLLKKPVFRIEDVNVYYGNLNSARSAVKRLMKEKIIVKIRNDMYTCISGETGQPVANHFQIASNITPTSYVSHHTAMEYYGIANQIYYDVYVSSETGFQDFEFNGYTYRYISSKTSSGIDKPAYSGGIWITDLERTLIDSIKDMDKIAGIEEIMQNIGNIYQLQEKKLLKYLKIYQKQFLYQKTGFLLFENRKNLGLSEHFFDVCKSKIGKSRRYLTKDMDTGQYDNEWKLIVPTNIFNMKNGVSEYADI